MVEGLQQRGTSPEKLEKKKKKKSLIYLQGFKRGLEVKGTADVVSRSFFSAWSLL